MVHPAPGNPDKTMLNAMLYHFPELIKIPRAGIIHRLDKNTSGLIAIARTLESHTKLVRELQERNVKREYEAIVEGVMISGGTIDEKIERDYYNKKRMCISQSGKKAVTHYRIIQRFLNHTHIKVILETGRTHHTCTYGTHKLSNIRFHVSCRPLLLLFPLFCRSHSFYHFHNIFIIPASFTLRHSHNYYVIPA